MERIESIRRDIEALSREGHLDPAFAEDILKYFSYDPPEELPDAQYVIIAAVPQPKLRAVFRWKDEDHALIVPATYANGPVVDKEVRELLEDAVRPSAGRFVKAVLPYKTLAARTGLVRYGRNNIAYAPGCGSLHRLTAFYTDLNLQMDHWQEREALPLCQRCARCLRACPTGAIGKDRFLLHGERCLTYLNEMPSDRPFPSWVDWRWHNAVVGCTRCQDVCPYNREVKDWFVDGERFSEGETARLLNGDFSGEDARELEEKLARCGLDRSCFPRNLSVLLLR